MPFMRKATNEELYPLQRKHLKDVYLKVFTIFHEKQGKMGYTLKAVLLHTFCKTLNIHTLFK